MLWRQSAAISSGLPRRAGDIPLRLNLFQDAHYVASAHYLRDLPPAGEPEVAFAGPLQRGQVQRHQRPRGAHAPRLREQAAGPHAADQLLRPEGRRLHRRPARLRLRQGAARSARALGRRPERLPAAAQRAHGHGAGDGFAASAHAARRTHARLVRRDRASRCTCCSPSPTSSRAANPRRRCRRCGRRLPRAAKATRRNSSPA